MHFIILLYISLLIHLFQINVQASSPPASSQASFLVRGNEMEYKHKENESHVTGNAYAERTITPAYPDSPPQHQVLTADNFHIYFHPNSPDNSSSQTFQSINYIKAKGNVTFKYEYLIIQADHCVYYAGSSSDKIQTAGRIICTQNVTLKKGNNTLKGEKAEADLNNGTYKVTTSGSSKKVEAILTPSQIRPEK